MARGLGATSNVTVTHHRPKSNVPTPSRTIIFDVQFVLKWGGKRTRAEHSTNGQNRHCSRRSNGAHADATEAWQLDRGAADVDAGGQA